MKKGFWKKQIGKDISFVQKENQRNRPLHSTEKTDKREESE
jgi:hypothetical protein